MTTIFERVAKIKKEIGGVAAQYNVDSWSLEFLDNIEDRSWLTPKQEQKLIEIEHKVFDDDD